MMIEYSKCKVADLPFIQVRTRIPNKQLDIFTQIFRSSRPGIALKISNRSVHFTKPNILIYSFK